MWALNGEVTRLTGKRPSEAIKAKTVAQKNPPPLLAFSSRSSPRVCFIYQPGELEGCRRRAADPVWSLEVYRLGRSVTKPDEPVLYYLQDGPPRGFGREELGCLPNNRRMGSQALNSSSMYASISAKPAGFAPLCP